MHVQYYIISIYSKFMIRIKKIIKKKLFFDFTSGYKILYFDAFGEKLGKILA